MSARGELRIERLTGAALQARLPALARLRIAVFRDFPYLYDGSEEYEARYLRTYAASPDSVIVAALAGEQVVGAATGVPLEHEPDYVTAPFRARGDDLARIFYFGESVLEKAYRGRGIGVAFFAEREAHVRALGRFRRVVFCGVDRPADHPAKPADYVPLDAFWRRRGYRPLAGVASQFSWRDIGGAAQTAKPMRYWYKDL